MRVNKKIILLLMILHSIFVSGQTKDELTKQKSKIIKDIKYTKELLNKIEFTKTKSLNYLNVLETQINSRKSLLTTLNIEIVLLNKQINKTETFIKRTIEAITSETQKLKILKDEYAKIIFLASLKINSRNDIMFIISSDNFNQAYKRILYLKQYSFYRKNQSVKISLSKSMLISKKEKLAQQKDRLIEESASKTMLLNSKRQELEIIKSTQSEKQDILIKLRKSEKKFKKNLLQQQKEAIDLDNKIRSIIAEELRKSKDVGRINKSKNLAEINSLSQGFFNKKGSLPWPTEKGVIVSNYGKQSHPVFFNIETFNNGIDIATDKNTDVRAVFDGIVSRIFFIKGEGKAVLLNHGQYFSVYSGLKEVIVKSGDKLISKEKIGVVITQEEENKTELHFEIWRGYEKLNPSIWLYNAY